MTSMTMAEARSRRNATAMHDQDCGLHDYASADEAHVALENSGILQSVLDNANPAEMAQWMWRNDTSPEAAAVAFGLEPSGE